MRKFGLQLASLLILAAAASPAAAQRSWDGGNATFVWGDNGNWSPDGSPAGVDISIGNLVAATNDTTLLDAAYTITSLTITNGADVVNSTDNGATNDFLLTVNGLTSISDTGSSIVIYGGDLNGLDTNLLTISAGGSLILNSTTPQGTAIVEVENGLFDLNVDGTLTGTGRIDLDDVLAAPTTLLINDGEIIANTTPAFIFQAPAAGTLQIASVDADARFDWDGGGNGVLQVNGNQTLDIDVQPGAGALADNFSGTMNLRTGSTIDVADAWGLDTGTINADTADFGLIIIGQDPSPGAAARIAGASWTMSGGTINVNDAWDSLQFDSAVTATGGTVNNVGKLIFNGDATFGSGVTFNMSSAAASLVVNSTVNIDVANFNLDGLGTVTNITTISAGGNLDLDLGAGADVNFNHTINMNGGELDVTTSAATAWTLAAGAKLNVTGTTTSVINSAGETFNINGDVAISGDGSLVVNSTSDFGATANVSIALGSSLDMSSVTYNGGSYTGAGIFNKGSATVAAPTTWNVARVNYDDGNTTVNANLTINADTLEPASDGIDSQTTIADNALLTVNLSGGAAWTLDSVGGVTYNGNATADTYLAGSDLNMNGTINHIGDGRTDARLTIGSTGVVNINTVGEPLRLNGGDNAAKPNRIAGGTVNGPGILGADPGRALRGFGTINADIDFNGASDLVADGGVLTLNGAILDVRNLGTNGAGSVLQVTNPWNTNVTDVVELNDGTLQGAGITNNGAAGIQGRGVVAAAVNNNSLIVADAAGTLRLANPASDWDGAGNAGVLRATSGILEVNDNAPFLFNGTVQADGGTVVANGFELEFEPASTLTLSGGTYRSTNATDIGGTVTVLAGASRLEIGGTTVFEATSASTLTGTLQLVNAATVVNAGATFAGGGVLQNFVADRVLQLNDGADVDVLVDNAGALELGPVGTPAQTTGLDFQQESPGVFNVDLGGLGLNQFDRMTLTGAATLTGALDIDLIGGFVPALGDAFTILSAPGGVGGSFTSVSEPAGLPAGTLFDVVYQPTFVQLVLKAAPLYSADFDLDGDVDGDDLVVWNGSFGVNDGADADNDGDSDGSDFLAWQQQLGSVPAVAAAHSVPEPSALVVAASLLGAAGSLRARPRRGERPRFG